MDLKFKRIKEREIAIGYFKVLKRTYLMPNGKTKVFDIKKTNKQVHTVALTPEGRIILVKQYRPGPERVLVDIPGGGAEDGESPLSAAKRELMEETGYTGRFKFIGTSIDDAYTTTIRYIFAARGCRKVAKPHPDGSEFIEVVEMSIAQFRKRLRSGEVTCAEVGYIGLDALGLL